MTKPQENPLVTNRKLKQIYAAMVEMRALDDYAARLLRRSRAKAKRLRPFRGEEACRVSTAIELASGDLVSDSQDGIAMEAVAGATTSALLRRLDEVRAGSKHRPARPAREGSTGRQLPWVENAGERLWMALGAAQSFKTLGRENIVVVYVRAREASGSSWWRTLSTAAKFELPIIFVVLPGMRDNKVGQSTSAKAQACGVPGFPVDASDAVALYRVAQESIGRTRGDGGPVLIECMKYASATKRKHAPDDPVAQMKSFLLGRKVAGSAWLNGVAPAFAKRMETARSKMRG